MRRAPPADSHRGIVAPYPCRPALGYPRGSHASGESEQGGEHLLVPVEGWATRHPIGHSGRLDSTLPDTQSLYVGITVTSALWISLWLRRLDEQCGVRRSDHHADVALIRPVKATRPRNLQGHLLGLASSQRTQLAQPGLFRKLQLNAGDLGLIRASCDRPLHTPRRAGRSRD